MTRELDGINFESRLRIEPYCDPVGDPLGHDPRSTYVERFWLPVLGPSTTLLLRLLVNRLDRHPTGCTIDVTETARELGLGERPGRHGPFLRSVSRAIDFDMARSLGPGSVAIRQRLPTLSARHLARLPDSLQIEHARFMNPTTTDPITRRGQQLALSLLELGESIGDTERQLALWNIGNELAHRCTLWASDELNGARKRSATMV